jgi:RPEL repeat
MQLIAGMDKLSIKEEVPAPESQGGALPREQTKLTPPSAPQSPQEKLQRFFDHRPTTEELKQRNILKDSKVAPALQSAQVPPPPTQSRLTFTKSELERKKLEDELSAKLSIRPDPEELVEKHILNRTRFVRDTNCSGRGAQPGTPAIAAGETYQVLRT